MATPLHAAQLPLLEELLIGPPGLVYMPSSGIPQTLQRYEGLAATACGSDEGTPWEAVERTAWIVIHVVVIEETAEITDEMLWKPEKAK